MMRLLEFYRRHFMVIEALACLALWGYILGFRLVTGRHVLNLDLPQDAILSVVVSGALSMLGFVLAGVTLLSAFSRQIEYLRRRDQGRLVIRIFFETIIGLGAAAALGLAAMVAEAGAETAVRWGLGLATLFAAVRTWRVVWVLYNLSMASVGARDRQG